MKTKQGFTLIELLVVVLIIGILSAIALPQYQKAVMKTRYAIMKPIVRHMYEAEKLYYLANGEYADTFDKLGVEIAGQTSTTKNLVFPWGHCTIESSYVYCYNYQLTMSYYINFNDERWCLTYDADKQYPLRHQICQSDTNNTPNTTGDYQYL